MDFISDSHSVRTNPEVRMAGPKGLADPGGDVTPMGLLASGKSAVSSNRWFLFKSDGPKSYAVSRAVPSVV